MVDTRSQLPPSQQIGVGVLDEVAAKGLRVGDRLPSVRQLALEAVVNPNTVAKAYADLERLGVVRGENGRGVFVTEEGPALARKQRLAETLEALERALELALRAGHSSAVLERVLRTAMREHAQ